MKCSSNTRSNCTLSYQTVTKIESESEMCQCNRLPFCKVFTCSEDKGNPEVLFAKNEELVTRVGELENYITQLEKHNQLLGGREKVVKPSRRHTADDRRPDDFHFWEKREKREKREKSALLNTWAGETTQFLRDASSETTDESSSCSLPRDGRYKMHHSRRHTSGNERISLDDLV